MDDKLIILPTIGFALPCHLVPFAILSCDPTMYIEITLWSGCALQLQPNILVFPSLAPIAAFLPSSSATAVAFAPETHTLYISRPAPFYSCVAYSVCPHIKILMKELHTQCAYSKVAYSVCLLKGCILCVPTQELLTLVPESHTAGSHAPSFRTVTWWPPQVDLLPAFVLRTMLTYNYCSTGLILSLIVEC